MLEICILTRNDRWNSFLNSKTGPFRLGETVTPFEWTHKYIPTCTNLTFKKKYCKN